MCKIFIEINYKTLLKDRKDVNPLQINLEIKCKFDLNTEFSVVVSKLIKFGDFSSVHDITGA